MNIDEKERKEILFWKDSSLEKPESESIENLINKLGEAGIFLEKLSRYKEYFDKAQLILEVGGGQGWASCIVKKKYSSSQVVTSDISQYAIESVKKWEDIFKTTLDQRLQCRSYEIPLEAESMDLVFCFQSAHHFIKHRKTLEEMHRVLKYRGICLYLHEPACRQYLHKLAYERVNKRRPEVPEDVLVYERIQKIAIETGFETSMYFDPTPLNRRPVETIYYLLLQRLPFLCKYLPCSVDFIFTKL